MKHGTCMRKLVGMAAVFGVLLCFLCGCGNEKPLDKLDTLSPLAPEQKLCAQFEAVSAEADSALTVYETADGTYQALEHGSDPVSIVTPEGLLLDTSNYPTDIEHDLTADVHFAQTGQNVYVCNEDCLYMVQSDKLTRLEETICWQGIGTVEDTAYGVGMVRGAGAEVSRTVLCALDGKEVKPLTRLDFPDSVRLVCGGRQLYLMTHNSIYSWDGHALQRLANLVDLGIDLRQVVDMSEAGEGLQIAVSNGVYTLTEEIQQPEIPGVTTLHVGYINDTIGNFSSALAKFQQQHDDIRLESRQYGSKEEALTAILAGDMPDILCMGFELAPMQAIAQKGLFRPLTDYVDAICAEGEYFDNVFRAGTLDGEIYYLCPSFSLEGITIPTPLLEGKTKINCVEDLEAVFAPTGKNAFQWHTTTDFLPWLIHDGYQQYIDGDTAHFDSEAFGEVLRFCNQFMDNWDAVLAAENMSICQIATIHSMEDYYHAQLRILRETPYDSLSYLPFPLSPYDGLSISGDYFVGISAKCDAPEQAEAFLNYLLSAEMQDQTVFSLPVRRDSCEKQLDLSGHEKYEEFPGLYRSCAEESKRLIQHAEHLILPCTPVVDIIQQEAAAYFAGDKTLEETQKLIQNRVTLYLQEQ